MADELFTTGQSAKRTKVTFMRVVYYLSSRHIEPIARIAGLRRFSPDTVERVTEIRQKIVEL